MGEGNDWHRPLSVLFSACFAAGFVLDAFEAPVPNAPSKSAASLSWDNYTEIPPILAVRLRPVSGEKMARAVVSGEQQGAGV